MPKESYSDLLAFIAVARERSFTRAAAQLGVSQSALSHQIRALEAKMGVRLLTRTTRSVSPTDTGERLMRSISPRFEEIEAELAAVGELGDTPSGTIRITASENAAEMALWPKLAKLLPEYPRINVEVSVESRFVDIVSERYDFGVRLGDDLARDMAAVRISADQRFAIIGAPAYLDRRPPPLRPQDLADHDCINLRLMSHGDIYAWELKKGAQQVNVRVEGRLVFNGTRQIIHAALAGFGLAYVPEAMARPFIAAGQLRSVLRDWCPVFTGYHLYYASGRQLSRAMQVLVDALRHPSREE
ncbi:LysR family transcriptional regulator [Achromobacter arsenitoxydans]|uniref:LysR family transcriptional regulator n=1 Tax=Achromobacter arsenitoxydans SY8 TaxID=477184 RepID=H0FDT3_9BURK|nr:LysR family transcriptional regulator [Achromobacter arsenitoxydans]EHK63594.1 LysR family transcriptional regulator [Achromobacter arsenitoxydans SY8]